MGKKWKKSNIKFSSHFNKKVFNYYYRVLKDRPQKVTVQFLTKTLIQNSKIDKQNSKFFTRPEAAGLNDSRDDEEFFFKSLALFIIIFFLWSLVLFIYFLFF